MCLPLGGACASDVGVEHPATVVVRLNLRDAAQAALAERVNHADRGQSQPVKRNGVKWAPLLAPPTSAAPENLDVSSHVTSSWNYWGLDLFLPFTSLIQAVGTPKTT